MTDFSTRLRPQGGRSAAFVMTMASVVAVLLASPAYAIYVDFADHIGAASGNSASIVDEGVSMTITSYPSRYDLSITDSGLGVACTDGRWQCWGNSPGQIDAEWNEAITISFDDGPMSVEFVDLSRIYTGEVAIVTVDTTSSVVRGTAWRSRDAQERLDLGGVVATHLTITTRGWFSDAALRGLEVTDAGGSAIVPIDPIRPGTAIPEPSAALLFGAAFAVIGTASRRD